MRYVYWLQSLVLLGGVLFAWNVVGDDIARGLDPFKVMCFYGAIGLSLAFLASTYVLCLKGKLCGLWQRAITWLLGAGTVFAWGNWSYVAYHLWRGEACNTGCPAGVTNPFLTPCFYGACIYIAGFLIALVLLYRGLSRNNYSVSIKCRFKRQS